MTDDKLLWCGECSEWMYARECEGDKKFCRRGKADGFEATVKTGMAIVAVLFGILLFVQIAALVLHIIVAFP